MKAVSGQPFFTESMKRVELLAPAGGYETMVGAFNAGADAVYLGGSKFGARAYADNFDTQQVLDAISYAHLHGKKIYMTVNTLLKERELSQLYDFMLPFAERRLDGVIVQDLGVMDFIHRNFPEIELHGSTQQTVTGYYGARLLKSLGCCRVVPARELSLTEMRNIRDKADIEVEAFIHGAMCYCYSGACLFSSMVGTRSGNRGRCAQPCRLPYEYGKEKGYPLSLKDMSTITMIPDLIRAGIDSFKIEGRMKRPEYSAGVTALYRKYIDRFYADPKAPFEVSGEDMEILRNLYQRTGISQGYYRKHNGKDMVTITSPAYNATSDEILKDVRDKYLTSTLKINCTMDCMLKVGEPAYLSMTVGDECVSVIGNAVQEASKKPMDRESVLKQLGKLGSTGYKAENIDITIDDLGSGKGIFMAVSELNELRRSLTEAMDKRLMGLDGDPAPVAANDSSTDENRAKDIESFRVYYESREKAGRLHVLVRTQEQLKAARKLIEKGEPIGRIYVDSDLFLESDLSGLDQCQVVAVLPYITREEDWDGSSFAWEIAQKAEAVLVRNLEQLGLLKDKEYKGRVILDYGVYTWNHGALEFLLKCNDPDKGFMISEISVPYELDFRESRDMAEAVKKICNIPISYNVYGRVPMMISAGCIKKTMDNCSGQMYKNHSDDLTIRDRMGNNLPVSCVCRSCYNVIWNAQPTSLHKKMDSIDRVACFDYLRLDMSVESGRDADEIMEFYLGLIQGYEGCDIFSERSYTTGHFGRQVE